MKKLKFAVGFAAIAAAGTVLMSHSQSGIYPFQVVALNTRGIAAIVSIEPGACPSPTDNLTPYLKMPILVLWGDYVDQSTRWSPRLKLCREFAAAANKAGGKVQNVAPEFSAAVVSGEVYGYTGATPYVRWGDVPVVVLAMLLALGGGWLARHGTSKIRG